MAIDVTVILIGTIIDIIIDLLIFWIFRIKGITVAVTIFLNFLIPYISIMLFIWSRPPIDQQISALTNFIITYTMNFVNFVLSAIFGYLISVPIYLIFGNRVPKPEF